MGESTRKQGGKLDGWPAKISRSLPIGTLNPILGRYRPNRDGNLREEEMDILALDERGRVQVESPRPVEAILEDILMKLTEVHEAILEIH